MVPARFIMIATSAALAIFGLALLFLPAETVRLIGFAGGSALQLQLTSALYLANAAANWTARGLEVGGLYSRPLVLANYTHFFMGALILFSGLRHIDAGAGYYGLLFAYCVGAVLFSLLLWGKPRARR
jgi:hypothetical protein